nr:MAG TPA: hypothetical protein [Caudoviricetes sp.]
MMPILNPCTFSIFILLSPFNKINYLFLSY